ncbi:hypothetical protein D3C87_460140 [compost metagenome]
MAVELEYYGVPPADYREVESRFRYVASASQTTFTAAYTVGFVDVFLNGSKLDPVIEFTGTDGINIILTVAAAAGDIIEIVSRRQLTPTDIYSRSQVDLLLSNYYGVTTNTGDAFSVTTTPSFTTLTNGMEIKLRMNAANTTTTPTLTPNGLGAKQVLTYNQQPCTIGDWGANSEITLRYNQALDKFIIVEGMLTAITPAVMDVTSKIATTAFVKAALGSLSGSGGSLTADKTLTAADAGKWFSIENSGINIFLPLANTVTAGTTFLIRKRVGSVTIANVYHNAGLIRTYRNVEANMTLFISDGSASYIQQDIPEGALPLTFSPNGYQKLPSGLIIQWGSVAAVPAASGTGVTFSINFPTAIMQGYATIQNSAGSSAAMAAGVGFTTVSGMTVFNNGNALSTAISWMAIGY